jgi:hypothetical protein
MAFCSNKSMPQQPLRMPKPDCNERSVNHARMTLYTSEGKRRDVSVLKQVIQGQLVSCCEEITRIISGLCREMSVFLISKCPTFALGPSFYRKRTECSNSHSRTTASVRPSRETKQMTREAATSAAKYKTKGRKLQRGVT